MSGMIVGIGLDIIEIERIAKAIGRPRFCDRVFTAAEQSYCNSRKAGRAASYAARFAGKEAVLKALGTGLRGGRWQDIEILTDEQGKPIVKLTGYVGQVAQQLGVDNIHISLTHARQYAAAQVILSKGGHPQ